MERLVQPCHRWPRAVLESPALGGFHSHVDVAPGDVVQWAGGTAGAGGLCTFAPFPCWQVEQLKLYEMLISQARQPLLRHKPVLTPLLRLLSVCAEPASAPLENSLVLLLNQLCVSVAREPAILELFFHSHTDQGPANLIIFSLLIPFIHHEGARGQQARDALLLIMAMSASNRAVAQSITDNSYFCPVRIPGASPSSSGQCSPPHGDVPSLGQCWDPALLAQGWVGLLGQEPWTWRSLALAWGWWGQGWRLWGAWE